jgi:hypothetical protein
MKEGRFRKIFCSAAIVIALVPCDNLLQAAQQDTTTQEIRRSYIALGAGVNLWTEGGIAIDGTAAISIIIPVSGPWWFQLEVGAWEVQRRWPLAGRIGIAMRYDICLTDRFSIYPKAGVGLVFVLPPFHATVGGGISYMLNQKIGIFMEAGGHLAYRESQIRANYYFMSTYVGAGFTFRP